MDSVADDTKTGAQLPDSTACLNPYSISSGLSVSPSKYRISNSSSPSAAASSSSVRAAANVSTYSSGMSSVVPPEPGLAFCANMPIIPWKFDFSPQGSATGMSFLSDASCCTELSALL